MQTLLAAGRKAKPGTVMSAVGRAMKEVPGRTAMPAQEDHAVTMVHVALVAMTAPVVVPDPKARTVRNVPLDHEARAVTQGREKLPVSAAPWVPMAPTVKSVPQGPGVHGRMTGAAQVMTKTDRPSRGSRRAAMNALSARVIH